MALNAKMALLNNFVNGAYDCLPLHGRGHGSQSRPWESEINMFKMIKNCPIIDFPSAILNQLIVPAKYKQAKTVQFSNDQAGRPLTTCKLGGGHSPRVS